MLREEIEMCPHCDTEITIEWDVENDGYEVICPECGEPIYFDDWTAEETADWSMCPICEINLYEDVE